MQCSLDLRHYALANSSDAYIGFPNKDFTEIPV